MAKRGRLRRDIAGVGPEPRRTGLHPLSGLKDFRIGKGEPDIRGWEVRTLNGRDVGLVDDLLVDTDAGEVVMLDIEMRGSERHIELPIRSAQLDQEAKRVIVDSGDVELYAGSVSDDVRSRADRDDRTFIDRDREPIMNRDGPEYDERATHDVRLRGRDADAIERDQLEPELRSETDEVVVDRRPVE